MLTINPSQLILTILNFFLLLFWLKRFFYAPLIRFMDARRDRIQEALDQEQEAFAVVRELERFLASRRKEHLDEAQRILADAQNADKQHYDMVVARAKQQLLEDRKAAGDAALEGNKKERRQLDEQQEQLADLLAESLVNRLADMPQVVFMDGRRIIDRRRKLRSVQGQSLFAVDSKAIHETEQKRNEQEQKQLEDQREQLSALLAEHLAAEFFNKPLVLYRDGRAVRVEQRREKAGGILRKQEPALAAGQMPAAAGACGFTKVWNLFGADGHLKNEAELKRNEEEQQLMEAHWEQLAAMLAEQLLCPPGA